MMRGNGPRLGAFTAALLACAVGSLQATQLPEPYGGSGFGEEHGIVTTRHSVNVNGRTLAYTARAGHIPIRVNDTGDVHGRMFFIAYTLDRAPDAPPRPLTFLWNGGPGSSSSLVHLLGFGPKRLNRDGAAVANDGTWLSASDLVFVDPIGTGYSRPTKAEYAAEFYQNRGDAESIAEFIRVWITRADAWDAPLFLAGESFGVSRAVRVAGVLQRNETAVRGLMLIGLVPPLLSVEADVRTALAVPTYAAAAHYHGKLASGPPRPLDRLIAEARSWALETYAPALARRLALGPAERAAVRARLAGLVGVDTASIDSTLVLRMDRFTHELLRDSGLVVGRYDTRLTGRAEPQSMYDPTRDPSLTDIIDDVAVVRYMRGDLRFLSDLRYQGPFGGGYPPATSFRGDWMSVLWNRDDLAAMQGTARDSVPELQRVMRADGDLHVYAACGWYDLVCSQAVIEYMADKLDARLARNLVVRAYTGGHAIYTDAEARRRMHEDVTAFIDRAMTRR